MARTMGDLAQLLEVMAGYDPKAPLSLANLPKGFATLLQPKAKGVRIGWLGDLNGYLPMEVGVLEACENGLKRLQGLGCHVEPVDLGYSPEAAWQTWLAWRRVLTASRIAPMVAKGRDLVKPEALWEFDQAAGMKASEFLQASSDRTAFYQHMLGLMRRFDVLVLPSCQVWPFDAALRWPQQIQTPQGAVQMDTYHRWMEVVLYASLAGLPALNVPVGFSAHGLPMGMQLIGQPQGELALLALGLAYEDVVGDWLAQKPDSRPKQ
jgi:amidase